MAPGARRTAAGNGAAVGLALCSVTITVMGAALFGDVFRFWRGGGPDSSDEEFIELMLGTFGLVSLLAAGLGAVAWAFRRQWPASLSLVYMMFYGPLAVVSGTLLILSLDPQSAAISNASDILFVVAFAVTCLGATSAVVLAVKLDLDD